MKQDIHDTNWGQQLNDWEQAPAPSPAAWDTPPDALWPRIEQDLPPRKRRRPFFFWLLGVGLIGLGAWWYVSNSEWAMGNWQLAKTELAIGNGQLAKSDSKSEVGSAKSELAMGNRQLATGNGQLAKSDSKSEAGSAKSEGRIREFEDFTPKKALKGRHTPAKGGALRGSTKSVSKSEAGSAKSEGALSDGQVPAAEWTMGNGQLAKSEVGNAKSEEGTAPTSDSLYTPKSSNLQILASSNPQILESSTLQILDSSNPRLPPTDLLNGRQPIQLSQTGDSPSLPSDFALPTSDFPKWSIGASLLYGVPNTTKARLPGRTFHFEAQTGWGLHVQRQLTPKWHVQTGLSRQTLDYRVDTRFVRLINFNDETPNGNVRTSTVNLTTALKADADDASPVELERPASSGSNFPNRVVLVTQDAVDIRKISVPLQVGYRVWQHYPFRLDAQAGLQWTSYRAEIVRESIRVEHNFFRLRSPDVQRRPPLVVNGNYFQWSAGLTASVHLHPNWQLALQAQTLSGRTEVLERLSAFTPQVDLGVRYWF